MPAPSTKVAKCSSYLSTFETTVSGIPCYCGVVNYVAAEPMQVTGTGFGDAEPPALEEFEFEILDQYHNRARWLERKLKDGDADRLRREFEELIHEA